MDGLLQGRNSDSSFFALVRFHFKLSPLSVGNLVVLIQAGKVGSLVMSRALKDNFGHYQGIYPTLTSSLLWTYRSIDFLDIKAWIPSPRHPSMESFGPEKCLGWILWTPKSNSLLPKASLIYEAEVQKKWWKCHPPDAFFLHHYILSLYNRCSYYRGVSLFLFFVVFFV